MKLYTEEQVRKAIELAQECEHDCGGVYFYYTETGVLEELTPIELPSDEEINNSKFSSSNPEQELYNDGYEQGAKWMRDKLTNTKEK